MCSCVHHFETKVTLTSRAIKPVSPRMNGLVKTRESVLFHNFRRLEGRDYAGRLDYMSPDEIFIVKVSIQLAKDELGTDTAFSRFVVGVVHICQGQKNFLVQNIGRNSLNIFLAQI